jgi:hypothetical protein
MNPKVKNRQRAAFEHLLQAFAEQLITNGGNASLALRTVDPSYTTSKTRLWQRASELKRHPTVTRLCDEARERSSSALAIALERYDVTADRAASEMARLAYTELRQVCEWGEVIDENGRKQPFLRVLPAVEIDNDAHKALVSIKRKADGSLEITLADKLAAQMNIARLKGYIQEKPDAPGNAVQLIIQR